jgi:hypothetical protein
MSRDPGSSERTGREAPLLLSSPPEKIMASRFLCWMPDRLTPLCGAGSGMTTLEAGRALHPSRAPGQWTAADRLTGGQIEVILVDRRAG